MRGSLADRNTISGKSRIEFASQIAGNRNLAEANWPILFA
jgi:hypothetical protein